MTILRPMRQEAFPAYLEAAVSAYAHENVSAGRWLQAGALERSREDFAVLLPQGLATPGQFLLEILAEGEGAVVGVVWYAIDRKHGSTAAYIYDLEIHPEHRRQGHARRALRSLERLAVLAGASCVGLNVFINNAEAQALYRQLGFEPTNINMSKRIG